MREFLQGYKGSNRKFMAPVSESKFNADVMEFKDTNSNRVPFQMANKKGFSTKNADVIGLLGFLLDLYLRCGLRCPGGGPGAQDARPAPI